MPVVMNCLDRENQVTVGGNTFSFSPLQIKEIHNSDLAREIGRTRKNLGFNELPEELVYLTHSRPGKPAPDPDADHVAIIADARKEGVDAYVAKLRAAVYNEQVSLRRDYDRMNIKSDPRHDMHPNMVKNLEELVKYQAHKDDSVEQQVNKIKELEKKIASGK